MKRIVVLGATGYAGGLAIDALLRRGMRPVLAGTSEDKVAALAAELGDLPYQVADATDVSRVRALVEPGDVLVTTVGPFNRLGTAVAQAAAEQGAHYIDSTGEVDFSHAITQRHDHRAKATGAVMLSAFGNDYVPGFLAAGHAIRDGGASVRQLEIGYFIDGALNGGKGLSQGTRKTTAEGLMLPVLEWSNRRLVGRRAASRTRVFHAGGRRKSAVLASGTEVLYLPDDYPQLDSVAVYQGWFPEASRIMPALSLLLSTLARTKAGARVVGAILSRTAGPPGGPDAAERALTGARTVAIAKDGSGRVMSEVQVVGPNVYDLTAELMAWAAERLVNGEFASAGVVSPIQAFGFDELSRACGELGLSVEKSGWSADPAP